MTLQNGPLQTDATPVGDCGAPSMLAIALANDILQ